MALETALAAHHWDHVADPRRRKHLQPHAAGCDARDDRRPASTARPGWRRSALRTGTVAGWSCASPATLEALRRAAGRAAAGRVDGLAGLVGRPRAAALLDDEIVEATSTSTARTLTGAPELRARWKRGVGLVEGPLGEAVGKLYVARALPAGGQGPDARAGRQPGRGLPPPHRGPRLDEPTPPGRAPWRSSSAFTPKVGYPDEWRDYSTLEISRRRPGRQPPPGGRVRDRPRAGPSSAGPVDRDEWFMTPQTVNAYYNPRMNEIVFPAAILQPPFFDPDADAAVNYGAIGAVIGHEIGHGFDDQGSRYDGAGQPRRLVDRRRPGRASRSWTEALIGQYDGLSPRRLPGHPVNGALTVGENIGDLGGLTIAQHAYRSPWTATARAGASTGSPESSGSSWAGPRRGAPSAATRRRCGSWPSTRTRPRSSAATSWPTSTSSTRPSRSHPGTGCGASRPTGWPSGSPAHALASRGRRQVTCVSDPRSTTCVGSTTCSTTPIGSSARRSASSVASRPSAADRGPRR